MKACHSGSVPILERVDRGRRRQLLALGAVLAHCALGGCDRRQSEPPPDARPEDKLIVFAAASLREAFGQLGEEFEKSHPTVAVALNFAGTQEIRTQLEQGAVVDVFAAADVRHMAALKAAGKVEAPQVFAENEPVVVVAKEEARSIRTFAELTNAPKIVLGAAEVPIGKYTLQILDQASRVLGPDFRARVEARVVSRELNVRQVLAKVNLGEADAGIVYRSDLAAKGDQVGVVVIPPEINVIAQYPIAVVRGAPHRDLARAWVALTVSDRGRDILRRALFTAPAIVERVPR